MSPSTGSRSVRTSGQAAETSAHSTGLSSRKMKLSSPRFSSRASERMFCDLGCQLTRQETRCSAFQHHVRAAVEDLEHVGLGVLAAEAEQEPLAGQLDHESLEVPPGRRDRDATRPLLADDALPEGVVAVEDDDLVGRGESACGSAGPAACPSRRTTGGRVRDVAQPVALRVVIIRHGVELELARADHRHAGHVAQLRGDPGGGPLERAASVARRPGGRASRGRGRRSAACSTAPPSPAPRRSGRTRSAPASPRCPSRPPDPGSARSQSSGRTSTILAPRRFRENRLPGSSSCWKTWL